MSYVLAHSKESATSDGGGKRITVYTNDATVAGALTGNLVQIGGNLIGVALESYDAAAGCITLDLENAYLMTVKGKDHTGTSRAIAVGDFVYIDTSGSVPEIRSAGAGVPSGKVKFGWAMQPVNSGATAEIAVKLSMHPAEI